MIARATLAVTLVLALGMSARADPGAPPNVTPAPPSVSSPPPNVTPTVPTLMPGVPTFVTPARRCRNVWVTDDFGFSRRARRCR
jgi:hypothetical protein